MADWASGVRRGMGEGLDCRPSVKVRPVSASPERRMACLGREVSEGSLSWRTRTSWRWAALRRAGMASGSCRSVNATRRLLAGSEGRRALIRWATTVFGEGGRARISLRVFRRWFREAEGGRWNPSDPRPANPTGLTRSVAARAMPPAMRQASSNFDVPGTEEIRMERESSMRRMTGICRGASYSLRNGFPVRAETRQSMWRTGSPGW